MHPSNTDRSLTPAATEALETIVGEYRQRILDEAHLRAVRVPGMEDEISVRDILESVDQMNKRRRRTRAKRFELTLEIYGILGVLIIMVGGAFLFYGKTGLTLTITQQFALIVVITGVMMVLSPIAFRRWRAIVEAGSTDSREPSFDASLVFIKKWQEIEKELRSAYESFGEAGTREPISLIVKALRSKGILSDDDTETFRFLLSLRNEMLHQAHEVDKAQMDRALETAERLLSKIH